MTLYPPHLQTAQNARYLDHQASKEAIAALAALEAAVELSRGTNQNEASHRRHAEKLLLLLRATCTGAALVDLNETNRVLRAAATAGQLAMGNHIPLGPGALSVDGILSAIPKMEISKAMLELMTGRERAADKDFVSYAAKQLAWRSDGRAYASQSQEERIAEGLLRASTVITTFSLNFLFCIAIGRRSSFVLIARRFVLPGSAPSCLRTEEP
jgi:hypothetical protein